MRIRERSTPISVKVTAQSQETVNKTDDKDEATTNERVGLWQQLAHSKVGHGLLGLVSFIGAMSPVTRRIGEQYNQAPARLAADTRKVTQLQARAENALRLDLFTRTDAVSASEMAQVVKLLGNGTLTSAQTQKLLGELMQRRGFSAEAAAVLTERFGQQDARMAAPRGKHTDAVAKAMTGNLVAASGASYQDVRQGAVGNCYVAAAAAAIVARDPSFPHRIIEERFDAKGDRSYGVTLSSNFLYLPQGQATFLVDDSVWASQDRTLYSKNTAGHWFQVIEQAAALEQGNFDKVETGFGFAGLARLTGLHAGFRLHAPGADVHRVFDEVMEHHRAGHAMTTGAHAFPDSAFAAQHAAVFSTLHEYAIIEVTGVDASSGRVRLYNPHGVELTITMDEFVRNFAGFSFLDLQQERPDIVVADALGLPARRRDDDHNTSDASMPQIVRSS
jgi:hypothetical protein